MQLTRLVIHKYRNVAPGTTLVFDAGKNVLLGKNATGKSTLLNLLAAVARSDFSALKGEEFSLEYEIITSQGWQLHVFARNERKSPLGLEPAELRQGTLGVLPLVQDATSLQFIWSLRLTFDAPPANIRVDTTPSATQVKFERASGEPISISIDDRSFLSENVFTSSLVAGVRAAAQAGPKWVKAVVDVMVSLVSIEQVRFDESLGFFERMLSRGVVLQWFAAEGSFSSITAGVSGQVGECIAQTLTRNSELSTVEYSSDQLEFLDTAVKQMGFSSGRLRAERIEKRVENNAKELHFGGVGFDFVREDGSAINHSLLSFGQKRLLAFYYYLDCYPHLVIADELVNGLHHHWIENCLDAVGDRQAFLTSQNPLLLDYLHFESAEQARSSFILCRTEKHDGHERMIWSNMTEEDAERFFTAYQSGIQHVSEILRTKGLW